MSTHLRAGDAGPLLRPTFFILGAARCATASLYNFLHQHPDITMSTPKEPDFFALEYGLGMPYYWKTYFPDSDRAAAAGDAAHRNLFLPYVPERIHKEVPEARLIVLVRDPTDRAVSHHWYQYSRRREPLDFEAAIAHDLRRLEKGDRFDTPQDMSRYLRSIGLPDNVNYFRTYLDSGYYDEQIARYIALFGKGALMVIPFSRFTNDPYPVLAEVLAFLGLDHTFEFRPLLARNRSRSLPAQRALEYLSSRFPLRKLVPRAAKRLTIPLIDSIDRAFSGGVPIGPPPISDQTRAWLDDHYRPHLQRLEELTNVRLSANAGGITEY